METIKTLPSEGFNIIDGSQKRGIVGEVTIPFRVQLQPRKRRVK